LRRDPAKREEKQDRDKTIQHLIEECGISPENAELVMEQDDDLWILSPEQRFVFEGEQDVRQWEEALAFAEALSSGFTHHGIGVVNEATAQQSS
jgi:hypothetical protein